MHASYLFYYLSCFYGFVRFSELLRLLWALWFVLSRLRSAAGRLSNRTAGRFVDKLYSVRHSERVGPTLSVLWVLAFGRTLGRPLLPLLSPNL